MNRPGNIFADIAACGESEQVCEILARPSLRIERIVSTGQTSPPGFWYEQPWDEWVLLLSGAARLQFENEASPTSLAAGDHLLIPAGVRHRVEWTCLDRPAVWLAVHYKPEDIRSVPDNGGEISLHD